MVFANRPQLESTDYYWVFMFFHAGLDVLLSICIMRNTNHEYNIFCQRINIFLFEKIKRHILEISWNIKGTLIFTIFILLSKVHYFKVFMGLCRYWHGQSNKNHQRTTHDDGYRNIRILIWNQKGYNKVSPLGNMFMQNTLIYYF